jgi:hypothetical protein
VPGNSYDLSVSYTPVPSCADDSYENNDTLSSATVLPGSNFNAAGLTSCPGDDDWYSYYANAGDELSIQVLFSHSAGDVDVELYSPSSSVGNPFLSSTSTTDNEYLTVTAPVTGYWKIRVLLASDAGTAGNNYNLSVSYVPTASCAEDSYENNDTSSTATMVGGGSYPGTQLFSLRSCPGDSDWFRVYVGFQTGYNLVVNLWFTHAFGDIDAEIYPPGSYPSGGNSSWASRATGIQNNETLTTVATTPGHWLVRVFMAGSDDSVPGNSYNLDIWQY